MSNQNENTLNVEPASDDGLRRSPRLREKAIKNQAIPPVEPVENNQPEWRHHNPPVEPVENNQPRQQAARKSILKSANKEVAKENGVNRSNQTLAIGHSTRSTLYNSVTSYNQMSENETRQTASTSSNPSGSRYQHYQSELRSNVAKDEVEDFKENFDHLVEIQNKFNESEKQLQETRNELKSYKEKCDNLEKQVEKYKSDLDSAEALADNQEKIVLKYINKIREIGKTREQELKAGMDEFEKRFNSIEISATPASSIENQAIQSSFVFQPPGVLDRTANTTVGSSIYGTPSEWPIRSLSSTFNSCTPNSTTANNINQNQSNKKTDSNNNVSTSQSNLSSKK